MTVNPELVKRLAELVDGDAWVMADVLVEAFPPDEWGDGSSTAKTGVRAQLEEYSEVLRRDHGVILASTTMREYRMTAIRWPQEDRSSCASFSAHYMLKGDDRKEKMALYLKRNKGRALSKRDVMRYRADDKPSKPLAPFPQRARRRLESTAKSMLVGGGRSISRDDWWHSAIVDDEQRKQFVTELRSLASRMAAAPKDEFDGDVGAAMDPPESYKKRSA